ncbi:mitochondrial chaperone BCS1 [Folsomia candida]|nr:mitochondrial chaperone BCS1 [Folsomia candida]
MSSPQVSEDFCPNRDNNMFTFFANNWIQDKLVTILLLLATLTVSIRLIRWSFVRIKKRFMISLQICGSGVCRETYNEIIYNSLLRWLARNPNCSGFRDQILISKQVPLPDDQLELSSKSEEISAIALGDEDPYDYRLVSSPNSWKYYFFKTIGIRSASSFLYKNARFEIHREYDNSHEIITLSTFPWNRSLLLEIIQECSPIAKKDDKTKQIIYQWRDGCSWQQMGGLKKKRPLDSLILDATILPRLVQDIKGFLKMENWYVEKGIPYRRGYLLHGPPGCGKSSIVKAIAGELGYNISVVSLSQRLTDDSITELLNSAPAKSVILLEDIDAAFGNREKVVEPDLEVVENKMSQTHFAFGGQSQSLLTFRGLLNALDGVASSDDGQIVFLTTNYPERLDPALIRPGRVDLKIHIDYPDDAQVGGMFDKFYAPHEDGGEIREKFIKLIREMKIKVSLAMIQGLLFLYRNDPRAAVEKAEEHFEEQFGSAKFSQGKL